MTAPSPTTRATPLGIPLQDGYQTLVTIEGDTDISIWEKSVTPPGIDGGDPVDTTTMHNSIWKTKAPRALADLTDCTFTGGYDPDVYDEILGILNNRTTITIDFPDGSTLAFYGFLKMFEPGELVEGEYPEATFTIVPTNWDPVADTEEAPVMTEVTGT